MKNKGVSNTLRIKILKRDNYECQKCGEADKTSKTLEIHHVNPFYQSHDDSFNNLITLCSTCHKYAPNSTEEFQRYISDQISAIATVLSKIFKKVIEEYTDKEWEELEQEIEKEQKLPINT